jgi:protein-S-isoprenylcysteine O-methyltransferase Ste14
MIELHGEKYLDYKKRTGMFLQNMACFLIKEL